MIHMRVDNKQAISFQQRTCANTKLKGVFDLRWAWVRELQDCNLVRAVYLNTHYNCADLLTKCLPNIDYNRLLGLAQKANLKCGPFTSSKVCVFKR